MKPQRKPYRRDDHPRRGPDLPGIQILALAFLVLILGHGPLSAQDLHVGAALADGGVGKRGLLDRPHPDIPPPPGLERMTLSQAFREHLTVWVSGEAARREQKLQIHAFHIRGGRVVDRFGTGSQFIIDEEDEPMQGVPVQRFIPGDQWLPGEVYESGILDRRIRGYDLARRSVPVREALETPGRLVVDGIFDASRKERMGDVLFLVAVPADRDLMRTTEATAMLVMF